MPRPPWCRAAWWIAVAGVAAVHVGLALKVREWLAAPGAREPARLQAVYTRQIMLQERPPAPARPAAPAQPRPPAVSVPRPERAASQPQPAGDFEQAQDSPPSAPAPAPGDPVLPDPAAPGGEGSLHGEAGANAFGGDQAAVPGADAGAGGGPSFEWPASTRLTYTLEGYYRGELHGSAQVEWLREGSRYEVHVDVTIGPSAASIMGRRMSSRGTITAEGLSPGRYDEDTRVAFRHRHATVRFGPEAVTLGNGREVPSMPGVQDAASQFVQLTYRLTTEPQLLQVGRVIDFPLALPKRLDRWYYEVAAQETLRTPVGEVPAFHLVPRRETPTRDALLAEMWFAPQLQYLPVRIRIRQDADSYIDLLIDRLPEQATAPATPASGTPP